MDATYENVAARYGAALGRVAESYTRPGQEREDLEQEIHLAIWRALPRFRGDSSLVTYIFRIAHNRGLAHVWRRRAYEPEVEVQSKGPSPEQEAIARQRRALLAEALRALPLNQRQPMSLALEGLPYAEIAQIIGITENNVAVRIHRARAEMRAWMEEHEDDRKQ